MTNYTSDSSIKTTNIKSENIQDKSKFCQTML